MRGKPHWNRRGGRARSPRRPPAAAECRMEGQSWPLAQGNGAARTPATSRQGPSPPDHAAWVAGAAQQRRALPRWARFRTPLCFGSAGSPHASASLRWRWRGQAAATVSTAETLGADSPGASYRCAVDGQVREWRPSRARPLGFANALARELEHSGAVGAQRTRGVASRPWGRAAAVCGHHGRRSRHRPVDAPRMQRGRARLSGTRPLANPRLPRLR